MINREVIVGCGLPYYIFSIVVLYSLFSLIIYFGDQSFIFEYMCAFMYVGEVLPLNELFDLYFFFVK